MGITNLVDHHNREQVADSRKEQAVEVVLDTVADNVAEDVQNDLSNNEEEYTEDDVAQRPAVLQCAQDENDLADEVDEEKDGVDNVCDNKDADGVLSVQTSPVLEGEEGDGAANDEHAEGGQSQQPDRQCCSVLVQLETDKSVDQQAGAQRGDETILCGGEVWVCGRTRRSDAGIENKRNNGEEEIDVEERRDLFATCTYMLVLSDFV